MLYFPSLVCWNGKSDGLRHQLCCFFDSEKKRPFVGSCRHSVCMECVQENPNMRCPICHTEGAFSNGTVNYNAPDVLRLYKENCVKVFENWWNESESNFDDGFCKRCYSMTEHLRICVTCEKTSSLSWIPPLIRIQEGFEEKLLLNIDVVSSARLHGALKCVDCVADDPDHQGHQTRRLCDVENAFSMVKKTSYMLAGKFLNTRLELKSDKNCKLRHMRLVYTGQRITAFLTHYFSMAESRELFKADRPDMKAKKNEIEDLLESLKQQWKEFEVEEVCECSEIWSKYGDDETVKTLYRGATCLNLEKIQHGCPLKFESNKSMISLPLPHVIKRLEHSKTPSAPAPATPLGPTTQSATKTLSAPNTSSTQVTGHSTGCVPYSEYKKLYDHVQTLTEAIEKLKSAVSKIAIVMEPESLEFMATSLPKLPKIHDVEEDK